MIHHRKPNRLKNFDYSTSGYYYVTICTKNRECWFGEIINKKMILNKIGNIVNKCWREIPQHYRNVSLDEFIIMPNHIHGIVVIKRLNNNQSTVGTGHCPVPTINKQNNHYGLLSKIINGFKNMSTKTIRKQMCSFQYQRSFYDNIIRNEQSLNEIRKYIQENPINWDNDRNNLNKMKSVTINSVF
jgi:REP element-mobilizing transposase RayT